MTTEAGSRARSWWAFALCAGCGLVVGGLLVGALGIALVLPAPESGSAGVAGSPTGPGAGGPPPAGVRVGRVEVKRLQEHVPMIGRLKEARRVTLSSEVEGKIVAVPVDVGSEVEGGQTVVARVDEVWLELGLRTAEAQLAVAEAQLSQSHSDLEQLERLEEVGSAQGREVEDQRTLVASNAARLEAAQAARERAQTELQRAAIIAPFDGQVSAKIVEVGQWVAPGDGVVEVVSTGEIDAMIDVPERYISALSLGDRVEVRVDAVDETFPGRVEAIQPDAMNASRTFPVKIRLSDPARKLRPGMSVVASLPINDARDYITVPRDAVMITPRGANVWYAMAGEAQGPPMAMNEPIRVLFSNGTRYAVEPLAGGEFPALTEGTRVVTEGAERLFPTQPLDIRGWAADNPTGEAPATQPDASARAAAE